MSQAKFLYRTSTIWNAFKEIYRLSPEKVDAFVGSFEVFTHDWRDEAELKSAYGENYYLVAQQKIRDYYSVLNLVLSLGSIEKMYIPPMLDYKKSLVENQDLFEERMVEDLRIKSSDKVLDIGCGRGRIAGHVARFSKAHVTGMNIDDEQLSQARKFAKEANLEDRVTFKKIDMNDIPLPFEAESFNAIYHVQAFSYSKDLYKLAKDLYRILKSGGRISCCDWVTLDNFDPKNKEHVRLVNETKIILGAVGTPSKDEYLDAFKQAGFTIIKAEVPSVEDTDVRNIDKASKEYRWIHRLVNFLVGVRLLPRHFQTLLNQLSRHVDSFMEVDRRKIGTTNYHIIAEKP